MDKNNLQDLNDQIMSLVEEFSTLLKGHNYFFEAIVISLNYMLGKIIVNSLCADGELDFGTSINTDIKLYDSPMMILLKKNIEQLIALAQDVGYSKEEFYQLGVILEKKFGFAIKPAKGKQSKEEMMEILNATLSENTKKTGKSDVNIN